MQAGPTLADKPLGLIYLFAFQAIIVGVMEIWVIIRERDSYGGDAFPPPG